MSKENITTEPFYNSTIPCDWEVISLGSLGKFSKGKGILKEQVVESGLPCIRYGEIYTTHDFIIREFKSFINDDVAKESNEIKNGDILFAGSGETIEEIGKAVAYVGNEIAYAGGDVIILSTNGNVKAECISYALETDFARKQKRRLGQGNSVVHIYPSDLSKVQIALPPLPEQKAIAHILSLMDTAINKNNLLIAKKEMQKKWLMQNLLTGKKRILNDELGIINDVWKTIKLGEFAKIKKGKALTSAEIVDGKIPVIAGGKSSPYCHNQFTHENVITVSASGAYAGYVSYHQTKIWASDCSVVEEIKGKSIISYLYYILCFNQEKIYKLQTGGAQPHVYPDDIHNLSFIIPNSLKEQTAIANVLQAADTEIKLLKTRTDKLREKKKGLMQVLLTGKKRLNYDSSDFYDDHDSENKIKNHLSIKSHKSNKS